MLETEISLIMLETEISLIMLESEINGETEITKIMLNN